MQLSVVIVILWIKRSQGCDTKLRKSGRLNILSSYFRKKSLITNCNFLIQQEAKCWNVVLFKMAKTRWKNNEIHFFSKSIKQIREYLCPTHNFGNALTKYAIPLWSCPFNNRDLQIGLRVRDWVRVRLFNSSFQASHYHNTYPFHPMSYSLYLNPTWRTRALETSLVWISKIVLVLNLVLVVQSEGP